MKTLLLAALAGLAAALPAAAQPRAPSAQIAYADLDLRDPAQAQVMLQRIRRAAASVCAPSATSHADILAADTCRREAVARSVAKLNAPAVTAAFDAGSAHMAWRR
jgi:UrcA family protein